MNCAKLKLYHVPDLSGCLSLLVPRSPMDDGAPLPAENAHAAPAQGASFSAHTSLGRLVQLVMPSLSQQPQARDLEAAVAPAIAADAAAPEAPADARHSLEGRIEHLRPLLEDMVNALPFVALLLIQFLSWHFVGMLALLWFSLWLHRTNATLQAAASQPSLIQPAMLLTRAFVVGCNVFLAEILLSSDGVWSCWWRIPLPPAGGAPTLPALLWLVVHNQYLLVFTFAAVKVVMLCSVSSVWSERRIKESLGFIESVCNAWLQLLPVLLWLRYLHDDRLAGSLQPLVIVYLTLKLRVCKHHFLRVRSSFTAAVLRRCPFGQYMPASECADRECAICLEGVTVPLKLPCDHIFCEACVMTWVQREATCPCCRAAVPGADGGGVPGNDGSTSLVPQLF
jgi:hypothetical protein